MPAKGERADPTALITIFVVGKGRRRSVQFHADPIPLTPRRMKLLARLVEDARWSRSKGFKRTTWDEIQATLETRGGPSS